MKIFVVTADIKLTKKPAWLDDFRHRYDKAYEYHITLKQPGLAEDEQVLDIKNKLNTFFFNIQIPNHSIPLTFDTLKASKDDPNDICLMINASNNEAIRNLHNQVISTLANYNNYYKPKYQTYEKNFEPHITIARNLNAQTFADASKVLEQDYTCAGVVNKVILTVVNNFGPEEANNPANQTVYS